MSNVEITSNSYRTLRGIFDTFLLTFGRKRLRLNIDEEDRASADLSMALGEAIPGETTGDLQVSQRVDAGGSRQAGTRYFLGSQYPPSENGCLDYG